MAIDFVSTACLVHSTLSAPLDGDWTFCAWMRARTNGIAGHYGRMIEVGSNDQVVLLDDSDGLQVQQEYVTSDETHANPSAWSRNVWTAVFGVHDSTTKLSSVFLGTETVPVAEVTYGLLTAGLGARTTGSTSAYMGNRPAGDRGFDGLITQAMMVGTKLSLTEMEQWRQGSLYIAGQRGTLQFWLPFTENTGTKINDKTGKQAWVADSAPTWNSAAPNVNFVYDMPIVRPRGPRLFGKAPHERTKPQDKGQSHQPNKKLRPQLTTVAGFAQTSDYDLVPIEGNGDAGRDSFGLLGNPKLIHPYPLPVTVAPEELLMVFAAAGGPSSSDQAITITATDPSVALRWIGAGIGSDTRMGETGANDNTNGRYGGMGIFFWLNKTGAPVTTNFTVNLTIGPDSSNGIPSRNTFLPHGFMWPVTVSGAIPVVPGDGAYILAQNQNGTPLVSGWYGGNGVVSYPRKSGTWLWGFHVNNGAGASNYAQGTGTELVWAYDNSATGYSYGIWRGTTPVVAGTGAVALPAISSGNSHTILVELQPTNGFYDNDIRNVKPNFVPGQFVKQAGDGKTTAVPVSLTGQKHIQPQGDDQQNVVSTLIQTVRQDENLKISPWTLPLTAQKFSDGLTNVRVDPFIVAPRSLAVLFCTFSNKTTHATVDTYTTSPITSVVQDPNGSNWLNWQLGSNGAGTRTFKGYNVALSSGYTAIYMAANDTDNYAIANPIFSFDAPITDQGTFPSGTGYAGYVVPVVFENAELSTTWPGATGIHLFSGNNGSGGTTMSSVSNNTSGSSWVWAMSASRSLGGGTWTIVTNLEAALNVAASSGSTQRTRPWTLYRGVKLQPQNGVPALNTSDSTGASVVAIEIRQRISAKPKRLVYPGFNKAGGPPGGRLEPFIPGEIIQGHLNIYAEQSGVGVRAIAVKVRVSGSWVSATAVKAQESGSWVIVA